MSITDTVLSFACEAQEELPLRQAAYRMAGIGACQIDIQDGRWICTLSVTDRAGLGAEALKKRFLAILNDENLREQIERRTAPVRDVIVALAFGALVRDERAIV
jgi:His-Xaa-Ser system protein HxsD